MQFCVRGTGAQPRHGKFLGNPVSGEHKMVISKITKVNPNFRSYLWKTVVVTRHRRILHNIFLHGLNKMAISVNIVIVNMKQRGKLILIYKWHQSPYSHSKAAVSHPVMIPDGIFLESAYGPQKAGGIFSVLLLFPAELLQLFSGKCFKSALRFSQEFYGGECDSGTQTHS